MTNSTSHLIKLCGTSRFLILIILFLISFTVPRVSSTEHYLTWRVKDSSTFGYIVIDNFPDSIELGKTYKINGTWSLQTLTEGDSANFTRIEWVVHTDSETQTLGFSAINGSLRKAQVIGFESHWYLPESIDGAGYLGIDAEFTVNNIDEPITPIEIFPGIEVPYKETVIIELNAAEYEYHNGEKVTVNGKLIPPVNEAIIELNYTQPDGSPIIRITKTDNEGDFNDTFIPGNLGLWRVQASWRGSTKYSIADSDPTAFQIDKIKTKITLKVDETKSLGKKIIVEGQLDPAIPNASIILNFTKLDGSSNMTNVAITKQDGSFLNTHYANTIGEWQVQASWVGNETYAKVITYPIAYEVTSQDLIYLIGYYLMFIFTKVTPFFVAFIALYLAVRWLWRKFGKRTYINIKPENDYTILEKILQFIKNKLIYRNSVPNS